MNNLDNFMLGTPALVCRWRLYDRRLPLQNRHLRALASRRVGGEPLSPALIGWVKQHLEWTLEDGAVQHPNGVLMLVVDNEGRAAMSVGAYTPLRHASANDLLVRARASRREAENTKVSPEDFWIVEGNTLVWAKDPESSAAGACSLIDDLARTLGMPVRRDEDLLEILTTRGLTTEEAFLVSDEHGVVPASDHNGTRAQKFAASYYSLLASKRTR